MLNPKLYERETVNELLEAQARQIEDRTRQAGRAAIEQSRLERVREIRDTVTRARKIAEREAHYSGGHIYLGGGALSRDYHSDWLPAGEVDEIADTIQEVKIERVLDVNRRDGIEIGVTFREVRLDVRLHDTVNDVFSGTEAGKVKFNRQGVLFKNQSGYEPLEPGMESWTMVTNLLDKLEVTPSTSIGG
jgi:hypothetical protein